MNKPIPCIDCITLPICMARFSKFKSTYMTDNQIVRGMYVNCDLLSDSLISIAMENGFVKGIRCDIEKSEILIAYFNSYG